MKKDLLVAVIIMLALPSKAQEYIKAMPCSSQERISDIWAVYRDT